MGKTEEDRIRTTKNSWKMRSSKGIARSMHLHTMHKGNGGEESPICRKLEPSGTCPATQWTTTAWAKNVYKECFEEHRGKSDNAGKMKEPRNGRKRTKEGKEETGMGVAVETTAAATNKKVKAHPSQHGPPTRGDK